MPDAGWLSRTEGEALKPPSQAELHPPESFSKVDLHH